MTPEQLWLSYWDRMVAEWRAIERGGKAEEGDYRAASWALSGLSELVIERGRTQAKWPLMLASPEELAHGGGRKWDAAGLC